MIAIATALLLAAAPGALPAESPGDVGDVKALGDAGATCSRNSDCGEGLACARATCGPRCRRDSDCRVGFCFTAVDEGSACVGESSQSPPPGRKPAASWSKQGWQKFRFGMGPDDVQAELPGDAECETVRGGGEERVECSSWPEKIAGVEPTVTLKCLDGELAEVQVYLAFPPPANVTGSGAERLQLRWRDNLRAAMIAKYGAPASEDGALKTKRGAALKDFYYAGWAKGAYSITFALGKESALITYSDVARIGRAAEAATRAAEEKVKVDPAGL